MTTTSAPLIYFWGQGALLGPEGFAGAMMVDRRLIPENFSGFSAVLEAIAGVNDNRSGHPEVGAQIRRKAELFRNLENGTYQGRPEDVGEGILMIIADLLREAPAEVITETARCVLNEYDVATDEASLRKWIALREPWIWQSAFIHLKGWKRAAGFDPFDWARHFEGIADWRLTAGNEKKAKTAYAMAAKMWVLSTMIFLSRHTGSPSEEGVGLLRASMLNDIRRGADDYRRAGRNKTEQSLMRLHDRLSEESPDTVGQLARTWRTALRHWLKTEA